MDWSNEDYVRMYTRDTTDDLELSWQALALWRALLCKFDRSGLLPARNGWRSVARATRMPEEIVTLAGAELVADGRVMEVQGGFLAPNFVEAQTASKSDRVRQRESRDRRRHAATAQVLVSADASHTVSQPVTSSHTPSQNVTLSYATLRSAHLRVDRSPNESATTQSPTDTAKSEVGEPRARKRRIPEDWQPRQQEQDLAHELGRDLASETAHFREHHAGKGTVHANWDMTFRTWLRNSKKWERGSSGTQRGVTSGRIEPKQPSEYPEGELAL